MTHGGADEFVIDVRIHRAVRSAVAVGLAVPLVAISVALIVIRQLVSWWPAQVLLGVLVALLGIKAAQRAGIQHAVLTYRGLREPPRMTRQGLWLKVFDPALLTLIPWSQISRMSLTQNNGSRTIRVHVHDPATIAEGKPRLMELLALNRARYGAPILLWLEGATVTSDQIAEAARRLSAGRVEVDRLE